MQRNPIRLILSNSGWLIADKIIRLALGVLIGAWVARFLGPKLFGEISYAVAYVALFQTVATLGLDGFIVRDIARNQGLAGEILGTAFVLRICIGSFCWLSAFALLAVTKGLHDPYAFLSAILGMNLVFQAFDGIDLWFQSQTQSRRTVVAKLCASVAANALKLVLILFRAPLYAFAAVLAFEVAAGALALGIVYRRFPAPAAWRFRATQAARLLLESWPFMIAGFVNMVQARIEFVMIESYLGAAALGQYAAAARFIEVSDVVFASLAVSVYPRISSLGADQSVSTMRKVYLLAVLTYVGILPLLFLVWLLMGYIYGPSYDMARRLFPLMALRPLLQYIGVTKTISIRVNFKSQYALFSSMVGALCAWGALLLLLPFYGLRGAVFAALFSYLVSNFLIDALFYRSNFRNVVYCWKEWPYFFAIIKGA